MNEKKDLLFIKIFDFCFVIFCIICIIAIFILNNETKRLLKEDTNPLIHKELCLQEINSEEVR